MKNLVFLIAFTVIFFGSIERSSGLKITEIKLPAPKLKGELSLEETIRKRESIRNFKDKELTLDQISQLLWAAQGITHDGKRAAPSAGATYPLEIYVVKSDGVFRYKTEDHKLERAVEGDQRTPLALAALGQRFIAEAPIDIVMAAVYSRTSWRYRERAERYVHMEAGHAAENIHLQAVALGLGSVPIGAFSDGKVKSVLSLPKDHEPLYIIPVGYSK